MQKGLNLGPFSMEYHQTPTLHPEGLEFDIQKDVGCFEIRVDHLPHQKTE